jgi:phospholipid-binding lipoprotein MlaA
MMFEITTTPSKLPGMRIRSFRVWCVVLVLLVIPASSFAAYFPGPPEVISALQHNPEEKDVFDAEVFSQEHLIPIDPSSGELIPSERGLPSEQDLFSEVEPSGSEVDPYSDETIEEEDDPFGDEGEGSSDLEEDPFADEEKEIAQMSDPFERWYNRPVYVFNDHFYEYFMRPVAQTYKDVVAENFRIMIRNLYDTVTFPGRFVSSLLQLKLNKAGKVIGRVLINCTLGFLCSVDVANEGFGIKPVEEDFGQVLGAYGIPSGPYLVLPLLGPSSIRDGVGRAGDAVMNPLFWVVPDFITGAGVTAGRMVNETSFFIEDIKALKESAVDPYVSIRDFYNQRREILVNE